MSVVVPSSAGQRSNIPGSGFPEFPHGCSAAGFVPGTPGYTRPVSARFSAAVAPGGNPGTGPRRHRSCGDGCAGTAVGAQTDIKSCREPRRERPGVVELMFQLVVVSLTLPM
jgi:hypothetical protein